MSKEYSYLNDLKIYKPLKIPNDTAWDRNRSLYGEFKSWMYNKYRYSKLNLILDKFIFTPVDNISNGFINFKLWYNVIWKNRNWDWRYIYDILQHKLFLQRQCLVEANRFVGVEVVNRDLTLLLNLIERVKTEFYTMESYDYIETNIRFEPTGEKYVDEDTGEEEETFTMEFDTIEDNLDIYFNKYKGIFNKVKKEYPK